MKRELLIETLAGEVRIAILEDDVVVDLIVEREAGASLVGNIYLGRVQRVVTGISAAFVDIGIPKAGFLPLRGGVTVTEGEAVRVQVARDAFGEKGAQLSLNLTLPGRLLVYGPDTGRISVSRQIEDEQERERLLRIVEDIAVDQEGFIVRTVAEGASAVQLAEEAENLRDAWEIVAAAQSGVTAPAVLYQDLDLLQRALRDNAQDDVSAIWFDNARAYGDAGRFCGRFAPGLADRLRLRDGVVSLFDDRGVEDAIDAALIDRVSLPSGGGIVIEGTEALTAIDVNSGRFVDGVDPQDSALRTNLEAATEVARQIRLRNIGGVIVVDFIDLEDEEAWPQILTRLEEGFVTDRVHCRVVGLTEAGLVELIRRRRRRPLAEILLNDCDHCEGTGRIRNAETTAFDVLRALRREALQGPAGPLTVCVEASVEAILNAMENEEGQSPLDFIGRAVIVRSEPDFAVDEFDIFVE
ncbi:MAG: Rne/Rng family ribonuclease [Proteobacteria bacterium]|nr:Rne/Rng family ribonuclease [Pseudomonadota bacterium]